MGTTSPALDDVSFTIPEGSIFGIMGRSGSGKTTVTRLLQLFHGNYEGLIKVDGTDLRQYDVDHLRGSFGVVLPQIGAVDLDQPLVIAVEQLQEAGDRGLARAAAPHDPENRALGDGERDVVERRARRAHIAEADAREVDAPDDRRPLQLYGHD